MLSNCPRCEVDLEGSPKTCPECGYNLAQYQSSSGHQSSSGTRPTATQAATTPPPMPPKSATQSTLMYCPDCGKQVSRMAQACPHCGRPLQVFPNPTPASATRPWYFSGLLITLLLFTFSPLGILLMWLQKPRSAFFGGFVTRFLITVLFGFFWLVGVAMMQADPKTVQVLPNSGSSNPGAVRFNPLAAPIVTMAEFNQLQNGMSYERVKSIIGTEGSLMSENKIDGVPGVMPSIETKMYGWQNQDGSNMNAMFQNNKMMQKSQFGLK